MSVDKSLKLIKIIIIFILSDFEESTDFDGTPIVCEMSLEMSLEGRGCSCS